MDIHDVVHHDGAIELYNRLRAQYLQQYGAVADSIDHIIMDIARLEEYKIGYQHDIEKRGVIELFAQGRQQFRRENKSVAAIARLADQQRKLLNELGLTAASRPTVDDSGQDEPEPDDFDKF